MNVWLAFVAASVAVANSIDLEKPGLIGSNL
jgi:hypothetical protein